MIYSPLLQRQLCCLMAGAHVELASSSFWEYLQALATQPDKHEQTQQLLNVLPRFLHQVDESYQQYERDLELSRRSLALSTSELSHLNQALKQQTEQQQQAIRRVSKLAEILAQRVGFAFDQKDQALHAVAGLLQHLFDSREQLGADLATSQQRCRLAIETTNLGLWDWDFERGHVYFSEEWCAILGYAQPDLQPDFEAWNHLIHPDDYARCGQVLRANIKGRRELFDMEMRMRHRDGHYVWVVTRGRVTQRRANGMALRAVGTMMDISARKAYEEALKFAKESAEQHQQSTSMLLAHMYQALKAPLQQLEQSTQEQPSPALLMQLAQIMRDVLLLAQLEAGDTLIEYHACDVSATLTEWCERYQQQSNIGMLVQIAPEMPKVMSVDMPRIVQILSLQCMSWTFVAPLKQVHVHAQFVAHPQQLKLRIEPIFAPSDPHMTSTQGLNDYLSQMAQRLIRVLGGYAQPIERQPEDAIELFVPVSAAQVSWQNWQVLGVCLQPEQRQHIMAVLQDLGLHGCWVDDERQAMIELLDAALDERSIDLVILANPCASEHGVQLASQIADSENLGQPKCVLCCDEPLPDMPPYIHAVWQLPLTPEQALRSLNQWVQPSMQLAPRTDGLMTEPLTVLLVEDNTINQRLVMSFLNKAGYRVELAAHGQQAIERFERQHFDAILMDIQMPVMGGVEATKLIRQIEQQGPRVPIIAMTAHNLPGDQQRFLAYGMDGYLSKPIRFDALKQELKRVLSQPMHLVKPANSRGSDTPIIEHYFDLDAALLLVDGSYEELRTLAELFINNAPRRLMEIESAYRRADLEQLMHLAYQLKGESENFGYPRVSILAGQLVDLAQKQRVLELKSLLFEISNEVERLMTDLKLRVLAA